MEVSPALQTFAKPPGSGGEASRVPEGTQCLPRSRGQRGLVGPRAVEQLAERSGRLAFPAGSTPDPSPGIMYMRRWASWRWTEGQS